MKHAFSVARTLRPAIAVAVALITMLALAPLALATVSASPVTWMPADSTYGAGATPFVSVPDADPGTGATSLGPGAAYGAGYWDSCSTVYTFGFMNAAPADTCLPGADKTEIVATPLVAGVPLVLAFDKTPGQRVDFVAVAGDPDAPLSIEPADPAALTAAGRFTVRATVADPVQSASGDVAAGFGLVVDCSPADARDYQGSLFVTDMHWLDIDRLTRVVTGLAGLTAHGSYGVETTFDGIFTPAFLAGLGVADPAQVQSYVDLVPVAAWPTATFAVLGAGDGTLWAAGAWKYRLTNANWCTHTISFGLLSEPAQPVVVGPKGLVGAERPLFDWKRVSTAARYEVRVYKGGRLLVRKTGVTVSNWRPAKALPKGEWLTWKVRGVNALDHGAWSATPRFKIR